MILWNDTVEEQIADGCINAVFTSKQTNNTLMLLSGQIKPQLSQMVSDNLVCFVTVRWMVGTVIQVPEN